MSDTPETNEAQFQHDTFNGGDPWDPATGRYILVVPAKLSRKLEHERDEAREAFATATNHAIEAREMLRRIMDWSPCLPEYEPDAQHLKWQSDAHAARKFLEAAK